jgi:hypothetical protein
MPFSAGPNIAARPNLVFEYDTGDVQNSYKGEPTTNLLTYSSNFISNWIDYCGNLSNVTYNTTDVVAPDGTYSAVKIVRNNITSCGASTTWGLRYESGGTLVSGNTYTTSIWARCASGTVSMNFGLSDYYTTTVTLTTTWQRFSFTWNYTPPGQPERVFQFFSTNQDITYYAWGAQTEMKDHATQYIASGASQGVRSNTQGLLDVSGYNRTMSLANVSFTSAAQMTFDGTDDFLNVSSNFGTFGQYTIEHVSFYQTVNRMPIASIGGPLFYQYGDNSWYYTHGGVSGEYYYNGNNWNGQGPISGWGHWTIVYDGAKVSIYRQGQLTGTQNTSGTADFTNGLRIGNYTVGSYPWNGQIAIVRFYSSALSAQEVRRNYNQLKGRFNLP